MQRGRILLSVLTWKLLASPWENKNNYFDCCRNHTESVHPLVQRTYSYHGIADSSLHSAKPVWLGSGTNSLYPHGGSEGLNTSPLLLLSLCPYWPKTRSCHIHCGTLTPEYPPHPFGHLQFSLQSSDWRSKNRLNALMDHSEDLKIVQQGHFVHLLFFSAYYKRSFCGFFEDSPLSTRLHFAFVFSTNQYLSGSAGLRIVFTERCCVIWLNSTCIQFTLGW